MRTLALVLALLWAGPALAACPTPPAQPYDFTAGGPLRICVQGLNTSRITGTFMWEDETGADRSFDFVLEGPFADGEIREQPTPSDAFGAGSIRAHTSNSYGDSAANTVQALFKARPAPPPSGCASGESELLDEGTRVCCATDPNSLWRTPGGVYAWWSSCREL